jgi:hypothetical protein
VLAAASTDRFIFAKAFAAANASTTNDKAADLFDPALHDRR